MNFLRLHYSAFLLEYIAFLYATISLPLFVIFLGRMWCIVAAPGAIYI